MVDEKKKSLVESYIEIKRLTNLKEKLETKYSLKYSIPVSKLREILVDGGTEFADSMMNKILKNDDILEELQNTILLIAIENKFINQEIECMVRIGEETPVIVFLKDYKDLKLKRYLSFAEIAKKVFSSERTVKRRYYEYKNSLIFRKK